MTDRYIDRFADTLFENGLETYDKAQRTDPTTKGFVNMGGAKVYAQLNFRGPDSPIVVKHKGFKQALQDSRCIVHTVNRIQLEEDGSPARTKDGKGFLRTHTGLMLYCEFDEDVQEASNVLGRINESISTDLSNYMDVVTNIPSLAGKLDLFRELKYQNFLGEMVPMKPEFCILLAIRSGPPSSNSLWSFDNQKAKSRTAMSNSVTASDAETNDIPF